MAKKVAVVVRAEHHGSVLAADGFGGESSAPPKVDQGLDILCRMPQKSKEHTICLLKQLSGLKVKDYLLVGRQERLFRNMRV
jgi:hypothetical protein